MVQSGTSGNIQGTFKEHSRNIQGTFREHPRNIKAYANSPSCWKPLIADTCQWYNLALQGTFREHSGNIQ
jgi:glutamine amidotransferase PdxT